MNIYNKIKIFYILFSFISLFLGVAIYVVLREGTYIHQFIPQVIINYTEHFRETFADNYFVAFLKYYFADFLWCISLSFLLLSVIDFKKQSYALIMSAVSALWGILFEIAQYFGFIRGTFDFIDIIMYIFASVLVAMINKKIIKRMS